MLISSAIQAAIYQLLNNAFNAEVYTSIPDDAKKPYAALDHLIIEDWLISPKGWHIEQQVTLLTNHKSSADLYSSINKLYEILKDKLDITDLRIVNQFISNLKIGSDSDGQHYASFVIKLWLVK
jgi:hypothetical protein